MIDLGNRIPFKNPVPNIGDKIKITRLGHCAQLCNIGDMLTVDDIQVWKGYLSVKCKIGENKKPSRLSSSHYEWEILGEKEDLRRVMDKMNEKLDYIIEFINKIKS